MNIFRHRVFPGYQPKTYPSSVNPPQGGTSVFDPNKIRKRSEKMRCLKCGSELQEGPSGGAAINMICTNIDCRTRWNDTPMGLQYVGVDPHPDEKEKRDQQIGEKIESKKQICYDHGYDLYHQEVELKDVDIPSDDYTFCHPGHLLQLARMGWMQASVDQVKYWLGRESLDKPNDPQIPDKPPPDYENPTFKSWLHPRQEGRVPQGFLCHPDDNQMNMKTVDMENSKRWWWKGKKKNEK